MKLYLHIGMSKAGSSAIQRALFENRALLKERGICYPESGIVWGDAHYRINEEIRRGSPEALRKALHECIGFNAGVLSCEGFWLFNEEQLDLFKKELCHLDVTVVLYLRYPESYLKSSYRQKIKQDYATCSFDVHAHRISGYLDFSKLLTSWGEKFKIRARTYEAVKHDLIADFVHTLGIDPSAFILPKKPINATPSDGSLKLMRLTNKIFSKRIARRICSNLLKNQSLFSTLGSLNDSGAQNMALAIASGWNWEILKKYLSESDLKHWK